MMKRPKRRGGFKRGLLRKQANIDANINYFNQAIGKYKTYRAAWLAARVAINRKEKNDEKM